MISAGHAHGCTESLKNSAGHADGCTTSLTNSAGHAHGDTVSLTNSASLAHECTISLKNTATRVQHRSQTVRATLTGVQNRSQTVQCGLDYKITSPSISRRRELSESGGKLGQKQLLKQFIPDSAYGKNEFSVTSKNLSIRTLMLEHRARRSVSIPLHYTIIWGEISASIPPRMGTDTSIVEWPIKPA
jgi:hypothetical protein